MKTFSLGVVLVCVFAGSVMAHVDLPITVQPDQTVCLPSKVCVAVSVLEVEFKGYDASQPPPRLALQQQVIDTSKAFAAQLEATQALQGQMGPLQAQINAQRLQGAQDALDGEWEMACKSLKLTFDKTARKCK